MTLAYVYKWTELATGKWYVGARGARGCHPDDGYICSSKVVKPLILANPNGWIETGGSNPLTPTKIPHIAPHTRRPAAARHTVTTINAAKICTRVMVSTEPLQPQPS